MCVCVCVCVCSWAAGGGVLQVAIVIGVPPPGAVEALAKHSYNNINNIYWKSTKSRRNRFAQHTPPAAISR